jgi:hypothetical protein
LKGDGSFSEDEDEMGDLTTQFYRNLYTSEGMVQMDQLLNKVPVKVTKMMSDLLLKSMIR